MSNAVGVVVDKREGNAELDGRDEPRNEVLHEVNEVGNSVDISNAGGHTNAGNAWSANKQEDKRNKQTTQDTTKWSNTHKRQAQE